MTGCEGEHRLDLQTNQTRLACSAAAKPKGVSCESRRPLFPCRLLTLIIAFLLLLLLLLLLCCRISVLASLYSARFGPRIQHCLSRRSTALFSSPPSSSLSTSSRRPPRSSTRNQLTYTVHTHADGSSAPLSVSALAASRRCQEDASCALHRSTSPSPFVELSTESTFLACLLLSSSAFSSSHVWSALHLTDIVFQSAHNDQPALIKQRPTTNILSTRHEPHDATTSLLTET